MSAKELVEYVARSLVDDPDAVQVTEVEDEEGMVLELHVAEDDMGKVIGRNGSVAKALRTLLKVTAARDGEPVQLEIL
ncbi:MAG: KH domain-containing protein [Chloroflexota bacterium]